MPGAAFSQSAGNRKQPKHPSMVNGQISGDGVTQCNNRQHRPQMDHSYTPQHDEPHKYNAEAETPGTKEFMLQDMILVHINI